MANSVGAIFVDLGLNANGLTSGLSAAQGRITAFGTGAKASLEKASVGMNASLASIGTKLNEIGAEKVAGLGEQFLELSKAVLLPLAAMATLEGAIEAVKGQVERADTAGKLADSLGLSVESLTQLQHAAEMADVSTDALSIGLRTLDKNALSVAQGTKGGPALAFEQLGISVKTASGALKPTNVLFDEAAQKLSAMTTSANKTALAQQLFGRSGSALIPLLNEGSAGLKELADQSDRLGLTISGSAAKGAAELADKVKLLGDRLQGIVSVVTQASIPAIEGMVDSISDLINGTDTSNVVIAAMENIIQNVSATVVELTGAAQQCVDVFEGLRSTFEGLQRGDTMGDALKVMNGAIQQASLDGAAADAKAKAILDGTYKSPDSGDKPTAPGSDTTNPISTKGGASQKSKIDEVTASLQRQIAALGQTAKQQAEANELAKAGVTAESAQGQQIVSLTDRLHDQKAAQDLLKADAGELRDGLKDVTTGFIQDLIAGKSAAEDLGDALTSIGNQLLALGENALFGGGATQGSGIIGDAINALFNIPGRAAGGPVTAGRPYVVGEKRPELFVPSTSGTIIPGLSNMGMPLGPPGPVKAANDNGAVHVTYAPTIDARGADSSAVAKLAQVQAQERASFDSRVLGSIRAAKRARKL